MALICSRLAIIMICWLGALILVDTLTGEDET
jgi:hypothetical protein